jgi:hypothetical protein
VSLNRRWWEEHRGTARYSAITATARVWSLPAPLQTQAFGKVAAEQVLAEAR